MEEKELSAGRVRSAAMQLLDRLEQAVKELDAVTMTCREKTKTESGETLTEYTQKLPRRRGLIDRAGLKQLTGVLKDLQEILSQDPEMDAREREAKLQKVEQELNQNTESDGILVTLAGEAKDYAL